MANFTKKAIKESFIRLLKERPLSKITVQVIADDCGINRNSFYYHFQDIPALIEEITLEEVDRLIEMYPEISSIEECLNVIAIITTSRKCHSQTCYQQGHDHQIHSFHFYTFLFHNDFLTQFLIAV